MMYFRLNNQIKDLVAYQMAEKLLVATFLSLNCSFTGCLNME